MGRPKARCWIGVVDQIDPPWISVVGERGESVMLSINRAYLGVKEGDWVVYWSAAQRLERLRSPLSSQSSKDLQRMLERLARSSQRRTRDEADFKAMLRP
jgi:hypothetical protein